MLLVLICIVMRFSCLFTVLIICFDFSLYSKYGLYLIVGVHLIVCFWFTINLGVMLVDYLKC